MSDPSRKKSFLRVAVVLAVSFGLAGLIMFLKPTPKLAEQPAPVLLVKTVRAATDSPEVHISGYGTIKAKDGLSLVAQVSGRVVETSPVFREGEKFKKLERLLKIDPQDYHLRVGAAEARVSELEAECARIEQQEKNLNSDLEIAKKDTELALAELERHRFLIKREVIAARLLESVEQKYLASKAKLQSVKNGLNLLGPQKAGLNARLESAKVALSEARLNLSRTSVNAPWEGWVLKKLVEAGQYVTTGTPLAELYRASSLEVEVGFSLREVEILKKAGGPGRPARVILETGDSGSAWQGRVARLKAEMDPATRTWPVVVELPIPLGPGGEGPRLVPGMFARVEISAGRLKRGTVLPVAALRGEGSVFVVEDGRLRRKPVTIIRADRDEAVVLGIAKGEEVVVSPVGEAGEGAEVRIAPGGSGDVNK